MGDFAESTPPILKIWLRPSRLLLLLLLLRVGLHVKLVFNSRSPHHGNWSLLMW